MTQPLEAPFGKLLTEPKNGLAGEFGAGLYGLVRLHLSV